MEIIIHRHQNGCNGIWNYGHTKSFSLFSIWICAGALLSFASMMRFKMHANRYCMFPFSIIAIRRSWATARGTTLINLQGCEHVITWHNTHIHTTNNGWLVTVVFSSCERKQKLNTLKTNEKLDITQAKQRPTFAICIAMARILSVIIIWCCQATTYLFLRHIEWI